MPSPAFQFYPDDFVGSGIVQAAEADEIGAYVLLLCLDWGEEGFAFDERRLARVCRLPVQRFRVVWSHLAPKFPPRDGRHYNTRLDKERTKQAEWREKSVKGGLASAAKRVKGGSSVVEPPLQPQGQPEHQPKGNTPVSSLQSPVTTTTTTPLLPEHPAKVAGRGNWPASVSAAWSRQIGPRSPGRVGNDLKLFADQYPDPADAERALLAAVDNFARHRKLALERGDLKPDNWPQFVRDLLDYVPATMKPKRVAA